MFERLAQAAGGGVEHRLSVFVLARVSVGVLGMALVTVGPYQSRLDAELPEREVGVGVEGDRGVRGERQVLGACVLEQVGAELVDQVVLDAVVAGAVLRGEPHGVLVGGVDARDGGGAVLVHLAGELAGELHRADLRAEEAPEGALDEGGERGLHGSQRIHRRSPSRIARTNGHASQTSDRTA